MSRFIGLDAHTQTCTAVVVGPSGRKLTERVLETNAKVLKEFVRSVSQPRVLCMEEGTLCAWLYEVLEPVVDKLIVVQPPKHHGTKNDSRDALVLANDARLGVTKGRVYKNPQPHRELREAVQAYRIVQRDMVRVKTRLHAVARSRGLAKIATDLYDPNDRLAVLDKLPVHMARKTKLWCDELDGLVDRCEDADKWLRDVAKRTAIIGRLTTAPGIGVMRAAQIVATVLTPFRFDSKRKFWAYCGLGIVTRSSNDWVLDGKVWRRSTVQHTRGLNRNRHPLMKNVFKGAAQTAIRMKDHPLRLHYEQLTANGTKPNLALLTIARRIAAAVLAMWKHNEDYNPDKHRR